MIDTHAHINTENFNDDIDDVIKSAKEDGIKNVIIPGIERAEFQSIIDLVEKYPDYIYCGIGVHPHSASELNDDILEEIEQRATHKNVVAIGEMGLDYYYDFNPKDIQKAAFRKQIRLAKKLNLPIIVHNRDSDEDLLNIIESEQDGSLRGVIHCFSSDLKTMKKAVDLGMNISFTGNITFKNYKDEEVVFNTPDDRIMLETDSPYMAPVPKRGKRNEPKYVKYVAEKIAEIKNKRIEEVISMTSQNAKALFKLPLILFLFLSINFLAVAQEEDDDTKYDPEAYLIEEEENTFEILENRFNKTLGIGGAVGMNTIIKSLYIGDEIQEISQPGILLYGGSLNYHVLDWINLQAAYIYSKNNNVVEQRKKDVPGIADSLLPEPNFHHLYELSANFIARSSSNMNFYGNLGSNLFFNNIDGNANNRIGIVFGVGLQYNLLFEDVGTLTIGAEIKFDFELTNTTETFQQTDLIDGEYTTKDVTETYRHQFTTPRLSIVFYPKLW